MTLPLVVGVDGSEAGLWATDWATDEAALHGVPLRIVHASLWERYEGPVFRQSAEVPAERALAQEIVGRAAERARQRRPDVKITVDIVPDDAEAALLREARHATAVVTGCRGRGAITGALLGSVSRSLATHATSPVVVVRGTLRNRQGTNGRIDRRGRQRNEHGGDPVRVPRGRSTALRAGRRTRLASARAQAPGTSAVRRRSRPPS